MRATSPQRVPLANGSGADVEWSREDSACFGELYSGRERACQKLCDARGQCWAAFKKKYQSPPPGPGEEPCSPR